jgi:hypothetical protein
VWLSLALAIALPVAALDSWWDAAWQLRTPLQVAVGEQPFASGYTGYTVTLAVPIDVWRAQGLLREDCGDLRVVRRVPPDDQVLPIQIDDCGAETATFSFMLRGDVTPGDADNSYWLYAGNPEAQAEPVESADAIYAYDLATDPDPLTTLTIAVPRAPLTLPEEPGLTTGDGALRFSFGDGLGARLILPVARGDLEVLLQMDHATCYPLNIRSGIGLRGDPADPEAGIWYLRGWNRNCGGGYSDDGQLRLFGDRYDPVAAPPPVPLLDHLISMRAHGNAPLQVQVDDQQIFSLSHDGASSEATSPSTASASIQIGQEDGRITILRARSYTEPEPVVIAGAATRRLLMERTRCEPSLPHELALEQANMAWVSDRMTVSLNLVVAATLEDPRGARQVLRISAAGSGGILRLDLLPGRQLSLQLATLNGVVQVDGTRPLVPDAEHLVILRYDGETLQLWLDGELAGSAPASGAVRRGDGPFTGLEGLSPRLQIRTLKIFGDAINRLELESSTAAESCTVEVG